MNAIRTVDFSDTQFKELLFDIYSAGFNAGYSRQASAYAGFRIWYRDVAQKGKLPVYMILESSARDMRNALDSVMCINEILHSKRYESIRPQLEFAVKVLKDFIAERC